MTTVVGGIDREPFTQAVLAQLRGAGLLVGDAQLPPAGNWQGGVGVSVFKAYVVVNEIVASHSWGPLADAQSDWQLPYLVECYGGTREACSRLGTKVRVALHAMLGSQVNTGSAPDVVGYGIYNVQYPSIDQVESVQEVQPPVWRSQNNVTLWVGKD